MRENFRLRGATFDGEWQPLGYLAGDLLGYNPYGTAHKDVSNRLLFVLPSA